MNCDDSLLKFDVPEIIYGPGALSKIGQCAKRLGGEKLFLVTDPGIIDAGWVDETIKSLQEEDLSYVLYDNVVTNPRDFQMEEGAQLYVQKNCDVLIAVGGGSSIDTAKGVAILVSNHGSIHDYEGCNRITQPIPPMVCAPTTAGTGADVTQFAVVTNTSSRTKMTILSRAIMPDISLIDPRLLETKSPELMAATGMDALTHALEAYVSSLSWSMTDPHAIHAVELVSEHLVNAVRYKRMEDLEGMSIACLEAGIAFSNAILGAVHALAHPLGGLYDVHHGVANSVLLPVVVRKNLEYSEDKYARLATAMGVNTGGMSLQEAALCLLERIDRLIEDLGLPTRLSVLGVNPDDIPLMAELAQEDICMMTNPRSYSTSEIEETYREAL
jgi:alcohol dehydrogenase class IV